ncbi:MCP four helix bundle domain-containing protein, partial [Acinetobacter baumannii]|uniref:MCP four helix bundle domain-containing protein n=1 Tax=Acinetobacter baumannii TaxID=470 RepID=UPI00149076AE
FAFFALVFVLGSLGLWRLHDVDLASSDIRSRWLQTTRILGDLNNVTSDFRAAEGRMLLSQTPVEAAASIREIDELDREFDRAQRG